MQVKYAMQCKKQGEVFILLKLYNLECTPIDNSMVIWQTSHFHITLFCLASVFCSVLYCSLYIKCECEQRNVCNSHIMSVPNIEYLVHCPLSGFDNTVNKCQSNGFKALNQFETIFFLFVSPSLCVFVYVFVCANNVAFFHRLLQMIGKYGKICDNLMNSFCVFAILWNSHLQTKNINFQL